MPTIYVDRAFTDDDRRRSLYSGDLHVLSPAQGAAGLCSLARELSEEAFASARACVTAHAVLNTAMKPTTQHTTEKIASAIGEENILGVSSGSAEWFHCALLFAARRSRK